MGDGGGALWAGKRPTSAPTWASFLPGVKHKGRQSAVAYATKMGHLIQVRIRCCACWFMSWFALSLRHRAASHVERGTCDRVTSDGTRN